jgi:hypothetical protein
MAMLITTVSAVALAPTTYAASVRQATASAMPVHVAITAYGVVDYSSGVVPVTVTYHVHSFSTGAYGTLLAQGHVHALSANTNEQLSYHMDMMHMVALSLPVGISLYGNQLYLHIGPGQTSLTVTINGSTYQAYLYTFPASAEYEQASFSRPSALGQLGDGLQAWNGQTIATAFNHLFSLS